MAGVSPRHAGHAVLLGAALACAAVAGAAQPGTAVGPLPPNLQGQWIVARVLVDDLTERRTLYVPDDPRLVGRTVDISAARIAADLPEGSSCEHPGLVPRGMKLADLLQATLPRRGGGPAQVNPGDYGLQDAGDSAVQVGWVRCGSGAFGPPLPRASARGLDLPDARSWIVESPSQAGLLVRWYDQTVLVLRKTGADARAQPSFDCGKARGEAETAICASRDLAAFDASVARAYRLAVEGCTGDAACAQQRREEQAHWLRSRNACGARPACLRDAMRARVEQLMTNSGGS